MYNISHHKDWYCCQHYVQYSNITECYCYQHYVQCSTHTKCDCHQHYVQYFHPHRMLSLSTLCTIFHRHRMLMPSTLCTIFHPIHNDIATDTMCTIPTPMEFHCCRHSNVNATKHNLAIKLKQQAANIRSATIGFSAAAGEASRATLTLHMYNNSNNDEAGDNGSNVERLNACRH